MQNINNSRFSSASNVSFTVAAFLAAILVLFSVLRMIGIVTAGSELQYADYWNMLDQFINPDGSLNAGGLLSLNNEHLVAIPKLVYWLNVRLFSGSNVALGLVDIGILSCQCLLVALMIKQSTLGRIEKVFALCLAGTLFFSMNGTWNLAKAMSGTSWLSANLFVCAALYFQSVKRKSATFICAILATLSYGTGILAWPTVIAAGILTRPIAQWWRVWPYAIAFVFFAIWILIHKNAAGDGQIVSHLLVLQRTAALFGNAIGLQGVWGQAAGWIPLLGIPSLACLAGLYRNKKDAAVWIGLAGYGWAATLLIAYGRSWSIGVVGLPSRYHSLAAIAWVGFAIVMLYAVRYLCGPGPVKHRHSNKPQGVAEGSGLFSASNIALLLFFPLIAAGLTAGPAVITGFERAREVQDLKEIALQLDLIDGTSFLTGGLGKKKFDFTGPMKALGHYPFVADWDRDCGLLGKIIMEDDATRTGGTLQKGQRLKGVNSAVVFRGEIPNHTGFEHTNLCILVVNHIGEVIGAGTRSSRDGEDMFVAIARGGKDPYSVYFVGKDREIMRAGGDIRESEVLDTKYLFDVFDATKK